MKIEIKIKKNEFDEYEVQYLENGIKNEAKTCYTDDKEDAELTASAMRKEVQKAEAEKLNSPEEAIDKLFPALEMSKAELFLRELRAEDEDDYNILRDRIAALVEELGVGIAGRLTIQKLYTLTGKIEGRPNTEFDVKEFNGFKSLDDKKVEVSDAKEIDCDCDGLDEDCPDCDGDGHLLA